MLHFLPIASRVQVGVVPERLHSVAADIRHQKGARVRKPYRMVATLECLTGGPVEEWYTAHLVSNVILATSLGTFQTYSPPNTLKSTVMIS